MKTTESKAMQEVWEWKENIYDESKKMSLHNYLELLHERMKPVVEKIRKSQEKNSEKLNREK